MGHELPRIERVPPEMGARLTELGRVWAQAPDRPRIPSEVKQSWDQLLSAWIDSDLPLVIRKSAGVRGAEIVHKTGRRLIICDNSPAQWAFARAFSGARYSLSDIRELLAKDSIPFAFATKSAEKHRMTYKCTLSAKDNVNKLGWKLCHMQDVGLSTRTPLEQIELRDLTTHCRLLMSPSNHFVVPLYWAGLGEVPEFIDELRGYEAHERRAG